MAKEKTKEAPAKVADKTAAPEFKYGISDVVEATGLTPETIRLKFRNLGVKKAGKSYGWNSKDELKTVVDKLKAAPAKEAPKAKETAKAKPAAKPAPKKKAA